MARVRPHALVPIDTPATLTAVRHRDRMAGVTRMNLPRLDSFMAAYDKRLCQAECRRLHIPGPESDTLDEALALLLFSPASKLMAAFTSRKLRQWPTSGGTTTVSESTAMTGIVEQMLPFFDHWRWRGPAEVDLKFDRRDGTYKVLEINPRFPGYLRFVTHCGLDLPLLAALLALEPGSVAARDFPASEVGQRFFCPDTSAPAGHGNPLAQRESASRF